MTLAIIGLIAGFFILIKSADYLVDGASSVAKKMSISPLVIGLTVIAFGTSAPELVVNIMSAVKDTAALAVGNIMGSNLANLLLILGITATIKPVRVQLATVWREIPFMLLASITVLIMAADVFLDGGMENVLTRTNGLVLIAFFVIFIYYSFISAKQGRGQELEKIKSRKGWLSALMIIGGLVGLFIGGNILVDSAISIATAFGVSESLIGLTIIAVGTSLPELATSIVAVRKGMVDLAVGNIVGSNIFNIFLVLGVTASVQPLPFSDANLVDAAVVIAAALILFAIIIVGKERSIKRWHGVGLLIMYLSYIAYSIVIYT